MNFICRNLFVVVTILIPSRGLYTRGIVPSIGKVNDRFSESGQFVEISDSAKQKPVNKSEFDIPPEFDFVPNSNDKGETQQYEELARGLRTKKSGPVPEAAMCFELPAQIPGEVPMTVCEPISVARGPSHGTNTARYTGPPHSTTPLVVLPPRQVASASPWPPAHKIQSVDGNSLPPQGANHVPPMQFPDLMLNPSLPPYQMNYVPFPPQMNYAPLLPPSQANYAPPQMNYAPILPSSQANYAPILPSSQANYAPIPPSSQANYAPLLPPSQANYAPLFHPSEANYAPILPSSQANYAPIPPSSQANYAPILPSSQANYAPILPSSQANYAPLFHPSEANYAPFPPQIYYTPPLSKTYYAPPPHHLFYASPDLFYNYGDANKPEGAPPAVESQGVPSKNRPTNKIKNQEEKHKVPSPLEDAVSSNDELKARAANTNAYPVAQEGPPSQFYGSNNQHLPDRGHPNSMYHPSSASLFTFGQNFDKSSELPSMNKFAPAALTCKMHDFEAKKPGESIAFLQLFLKPNPYVHNSYSEGVPGSSNSAGTFDVHGMEAESEMARHVHQQAAPWDWSQGQDFHFNGGQRPGLSKELNQGQWWSADRPQVWGPQQIRLVPNHHHLLLNKQLLTTESNKKGFQPPSPEGSRSSLATTQQQGTNETTDKQMRLDVAKAKLLQRYQTEARGQQGDKELPLSVSVSDCTDAQPCANASGETEGSTLHTRSADNIGDSKHEDSRAVHDPTNNGTDPSEIPENGPNSSAPSDDTEDISGNSTAGTSCKNSSCSEEAGNYTELQKGNTQEIHRDSNSYPKKIITYEKSTMNLKTSVTDWRNNTVHEKNLNKESTDSVPSFTEETSSTYNTLSKKGLSQSPLKIDSAQIPRSIDIPKNEFSNRNSSLHNETETAVTSLGSSDMMTTASLKFDTEVEGNQEADITTELGVNSGSYPQPQDNYTESSTTKTSNEVGMTGAGRTTPGDVIVTSAEFDAPRDSILSKARINSDSHKMDHSDEIVPHSNVNKSDTISKNAVGNDSFTNSTDKNLDFVAIKTKSRGSRVNFRMENKTVTTGTGKMFRSDIIVSSAESNTFHETNESTGGVNSNANEPGNNSSENPFLSEPVTAETLAREMTTPRESQLTPYGLNTESVATAMPVERSSHVISGEQSRNSNKSKGGEVLSTGSTSGHEISFNGEIKDNFNDSKKYVTERMGHTNESQTSLQSVDASSSPEDFKKSNVSTQDDASTVSSDKRNSATEITPPTEFAEGEASKVSDDVSVTEKGDAQSQKSNRQMKSVRGFPQTDKLHLGYSHGGSFQNSGKNRTGTYTQFQPIAPPNAMQFLVYANAQNPHYVGNGRGSGTLFRMFQQPFIYPPPPPLEHYDHSAGYNSNIRSGNKYDRRRNTGEATNTQAKVNADGRKAEDEFPVSITLGDK